MSEHEELIRIVTDEFELAKRQYNRDLWACSKGAVSEEELDKSKLLMDEAEEKLIKLREASNDERAKTPKNNSGKKKFI